MKKLYFLFFTLTTISYSFGQEIVAISGVQSSQATTVSNISANALSRGSGISSTGTSTFNSSGWTTGSSIATNDYIEWSVTANSGYTVTVNNIEIDYDRSNSGPTNVSIRTSLDSFASDIFTDASVSSSGEVVNFNTNLTSTDGGTITFRLYGYDASSGSGTFDIEDDLGTVLGQNDTGVILSGTVDATTSNDTDTEVYDPTTQVSALTVTAANATTSGTAFDALRFEIEDQGSGDALPTNLTTLRFVPGPNNTADWTDHIQGVTLFDETNSNDPLASGATINISDTEITITLDSATFISDGSSSEFLLGLFLNTSNIVDGSVIQLQIDAASNGFSANASGSDFIDPFTLGDIVGNNITIDIDADELRFTGQPNNVQVSSVMSPNVEVAYTDTNGNIDTDYDGSGFDISLTTSGSFDALATTTATASNGTATFSNLIFDTDGTGLTLTATDDSTFISGSFNSTTFDVTPIPTLGWQITAENTEFVIDFDTTVSGVNEGQFDGTGFTSTPSNGQLDSDAWATTEMSDGDTDFGDTSTSGDYARGTTSGNVSTGGFYAFETSTGNFSFGAQITGSDFMNGDIVLKSQNKTGQQVTSIKIDYTVYVFNNENRSTIIEFYYGEDENFGDYTYVNGLDVITPAGDDSSPTWVAEQRTTTITGLNIASNDYFYFNWYAIDNGGSGSRDEFGIDDIKVTFNPPVTYTYSGSWSPSDPSGSATINDTIVISSGDATITSNLSCDTFTVNPGAGVTINSGVTITVDDATDGFTLESTSSSYSSLILDGTITGTVNYKRAVNSYTNDMINNDNDLVSAPLSGQEFGDFASANSNLLASGDLRAFAPFNNDSGVYENYHITTNDMTNLDSGTAYRAATTDGGTLTFTGTVNTGMVSKNINVGSDTTYPEWNLIGNPYPSFIDAEAFLTHVVSTEVSNERNIDLLDGLSGIYGYDGDSSNGWDIITLANDDGRFIAPGQGFFVAADATQVSAHDIEFTAAMRSTSTADDFISGRTSNTELTFLKLNASTNDNDYTTEFYFDTDASQGLDAGYDAVIWGGNAPSFALYSHLVQENTGLPIALQALGSADISDITIPLGLNANAGEQLTFSITEMNIPNTIEVYLEDNVENTNTLLNNGDYIITPSANVLGTGRFFLRFADSALSITQNDLDNINIYTNQDSKTIIIAGQLTDSTNAFVYDIQGRLVTQTLLNSNNSSHTINVSNLMSGIYIVKLNNNAQEKVQKIILK